MPGRILYSVVIRSEENLSLRDAASFIQSALVKSGFQPDGVVLTAGALWDDFPIINDAMNEAEANSRRWLVKRFTEIDKEREAK